MKTNIHFLSHLSEFILEWEICQARVVEKIKKKEHIFCTIAFFFRQPYLLWDNAEQCSRAGQATDDNMANAHCLLGT